MNPTTALLALDAVLAVLAIAWGLPALVLLLRWLLEGGTR